MCVARAPRHVTTSATPMIWAYHRPRFSLKRSPPDAISGPVTISVAAPIGAKVRNAGHSDCSLVSSHGAPIAMVVKMMAAADYSPKAMYLRVRMVSWRSSSVLAVGTKVNASTSHGVLREEHRT